VFNTCAVTKEAERQARQAIRRTRKEFPHKKIIVTGCAAQLNPTSFIEMEEVDKVLGNEEKLKIENYSLSGNFEKILVNDIMSVTETASHLVSTFEGKTRAFVQIQNGCNHRCTYCTIPFARGNNRSVPIGGIVQQIRQLLETGFKEIVLTGVDISDYGLDLPGQPTLADLIRRLLKALPSLPRLRLSSIDVAEINPELFELICFEPRLMPHIHISLQSGDNLILKRMKRRHSREKVIEFCHAARSKRKDIAFGADIIAGFPTETEDMFINSLNLIEDAGLQYLHVFPYSEREDTPAARMPQIAPKIRKERAKQLREAGSIALEKFLKQYINSSQEALVETEFLARAANFATIKLNQNAVAGEIVNCRITSCNKVELIGEIIS
jgi:threonylcarbamoyladenosine tRNA methylthiotransferase MtaB